MLNNFFTTKVVIVMIGIILVLLVALAASQIGGIAIRSTGNSSQQLTLDVSSPALRGVPTVVRWSGGVAATEIELIWRTGQGETFVGRGTMNAQAARVSLPCTGGESGTLLLRDITSGEILGNRPLELLPPTAECLR